MALHEKRCAACEEATEPLPADSIEQLAGELSARWSVVDGHHLEGDWVFADFATALAFVNRAGAVCEAEWHHADFHFGWGRVKVLIWTHKVDGLTEADFVLAAKLDREA